MTTGSTEPFTALAGLAAEAEQRQLILAIDPGSEQSAWVTFDPRLGHPGDFGKVPNEQLLADLRGGLAAWQYAGPESIVVIEWTAPRGMPASAQLFETLWWAGRFAEACRPIAVERLERAHVKRHLCGTSAANDSNVRAALIDRFGGAGGKAVAIGLKASPGPLYGVSKDVWAALAIAVSWADGAR